MLLLPLALAATAPLTLPPVDGCAKDASFVEFRTELRHIIERRDSAALAQIVADDFWAGRPAVGVGRDRFVAAWAQKKPDDPSWKELSDILDLGCLMRGKLAWSPSFDDQLYALKRGYDSLTSTLARPGAVIHSRPNDGAPIVARSNWLILTDLEESDPGWIGVTLTNGHKGFIREDMTAGARTLSFYKKDGRWMITGLISGD